MKKILISAGIVMAMMAFNAASANAQSESTSVAGDSIPDFNEYTGLDEVEVVARKPLIKTEPNKIIYNTAEDPSAATSNVLDALRKVPMVSVDAEGNIKLKGNSDFRIFLNGKPDPSLSSNYRDVLKGMPASTVKNIEVWTEPGAKYDAEGTGGIINIVTVSMSKSEGYLATINASATNRNLTGGLNFMTQVGKVGLSLNYSHSYNFDNKVSLEQSVVYTNNALNHLYKINATVPGKGNFDNGSLHLSWEPDVNNLFTVSGNMYSYRNNNPLLGTYTMTSVDGVEQWSYKGKDRRKGNYTGVTLSTNYQHNFGNPNHNIVLGYQYNYGLNHSRNFAEYFDFFNRTEEDTPNTYNESRYPSNEHTVQLDYTLPLTTTQKLEIGAKYIARRNSGTSRSENLIDGVPVDPLDETEIKMNQYQDVAAVYGVYSGKFGSFSGNAGVRYEFTKMGTKFKTPGHTDYSANLNNVVPNATLSYNLTRGSMLTASYQMRISRPTVQQLDPQVDTSTPMILSYGNPELTSQKTNSVTISYSNFEWPVSVNVSGSYIRENDLIVSHIWVDANQYLNKTYDNLGFCNQANFFGYLRWSPIQGLNISVNGGAYYKNYHADSLNAKNHGWGWNLGADIDYTLPCDILVSLYGGAGNSGVSFQEGGMNWHYDGISFSKEFLKDNRLKLTLSAGSLITPTFKGTQITTVPGAETITDFKVQSWNIGVSVSYRLGSLKNGIKQTSKSIINDDLNSTGNGSGQPSIPGGR